MYKSSNIRKKQNIGWTTVKIDDQVTSPMPDEIAGIEELRDYTLVKHGSKVLIKSKDPIDMKKFKEKKFKHLKKKPKLKKSCLENIVNNCSSEKRENTIKSSIISVKNIEDDKEEITLPDDEKKYDYIQSLNNFKIEPDMMIWKAMFLPDSIVKAVWELGFTNPTAIQMAVLPTAIKGRRDVVGAAETGSGKTLAFGIPILHGIMKDKEFESKQETASLENVYDIKQCSENKLKETDPIMELIEAYGSACNQNKSVNKLRAVVITPTRELAVQIEKHLKALAKYTGITLALVIGGMAAPKQERILGKGPDIVIGTPGRLWELIQIGNPHLSQIGNIRYLALDETDRLLEQGHFTELRSILELINRDENRMRWRQNFVFSATLTLAHELPARIGNSKKRKRAEEMKLDKLLSLVGVRPKAKIVDLTEAAQTIKPATLTEMKVLSASMEDKDSYLYYFLRFNRGRTLVFCNSINNVRRLTSVFTLLEMKPMPLHAQMHQKQRLKHLERFSSVENSLLIATDVAARGLDIPHVQHVVHFQVPRTSENYIHRSGRTARASRDGLSLMLIEPGEATLFRKLCINLKKGKQDLPDYDIDMGVMGAIRQRVNLAKTIEIMEHRCKRKKSDENWTKKLALEADIIVDNSSDESDGGTQAHERANLMRALKLKRKELHQLLIRPFGRSLVQ